MVISCYVQQQVNLSADWQVYQGQTTSPAKSRISSIRSSTTGTHMGAQDALSPLGPSTAMLVAWPLARYSRQPLTS